MTDQYDEGGVKTALGNHRTALIAVASTFVFGLLFLEARRGVFREPELLAHPPTSAAPLDTPRAVVAVITLLFFVGLFMPTPIAM